MADVVHTKDLVRNPDLHPRQGKVDPMHVQRLVDVLRAGVKLPPAIVCQSTNQLIAGWHRSAAQERLFGVDEATIEVEWRQYTTDAERFEDALRDSASSQLGLSSFNQQSCVLRAEQLGIPFERVAAALSVPGDTLKRRVITAHIERRGAALTPLKAPFRHLSGHVLTDDQAVANGHSDGRNVTWHIDQIMRPLRADMLPWDDARMVNALAELRDALMNEPQLSAREERRAS